MPTVTLVPTALSDPSSNVAAGAFGDIDETIASADGSTLDSKTNQWTNYSSGSTASQFTFTMSDLPADAASINTVQFRVRARCTSTNPGDIENDATYKCYVSGTNAPSTVATWIAANDADGGFANRGASSGVTSPATVAEVNSWSVGVYQHTFSGASDSPPVLDGLNLEIDCVEIIVDYNTTSTSPPSDPAAGGAYVVIPTTDTSIYGLCIAQARDFVVLGGLDADRYSIRWSAIGDPTDWPTPATDDARSKQSGSQSFPTRYGYVTAIAGDDFNMIIFQEGAIHRASYVGGDIVWSFDTIDSSRGCVRQGRMEKIGNSIIFESKFGYHLIRDEQIVDIGFGAVDDTFT